MTISNELIIAQYAEAFTIRYSSKKPTRDARVQTNTL